MADADRAFDQAVWQNWHNYAKYYVIPYIGKRDVKDIDGAVCDARTPGSSPRAGSRPGPRNAPGCRRSMPGGSRTMAGPSPAAPTEMMPRCHRNHAEGDPAIGQPIEAKKPSRRTAEKAAEAARKKVSHGLEPKTVVNTHPMLHRAWEDFTIWGWAKRNTMSGAHPLRVPRKGHKFWTVAQLRTFLQQARQTASTRCGSWRSPRACGAVSWPARAGTCSTSKRARCHRPDPGRGGRQGHPVRPQTENAQYVLVLDPFTLAVLTVHVEMLDRERKEFVPDYQGHGLLFCWGERRPPASGHHYPAVKAISAAAGLPEIDLHGVRHSYATAGRDAKIDWKALSQRIGHADVAFTKKQYVQTDLEADRQVANTLAELIIGGQLFSADRTSGQAP